MNTVKMYRPAKSILTDIQRTLAAKPSIHQSALEAVAGLLCEGRHYSWVGIYLTLDPKSAPALLQDASELHQGQIAHPATRKKIIIANGHGGSEVTFTVFRAEAPDDAAWQGLQATIAADLRALRDQLQTSA